MRLLRRSRSQTYALGPPQRTTINRTSQAQPLQVRQWFLVRVPAPLKLTGAPQLPTGVREAAESPLARIAT